MADLLALEWDHEHLYGIEARTSAAEVRVSKSFHLAIPEQLSKLESPVEAGKWLQGELRRMGVTSRSVRLLLPRDVAVFRHLELPEVPDNELPDLVRMQAATRSAVSLDQLVLDFLPLPSRADDQGRHVLLVTVPQKLVTSIKRTLEEAGLEIDTVSIRSLAMSELVARCLDAGDASANDSNLTVSLHGDRVEISALHGRSILFTHSSRIERSEDSVSESENDDFVVTANAPMGSDGAGRSGNAKQNPEMTTAEVGRAVFAHQQILQQRSIRRTFILGVDDDCHELVERLRQRSIGEVQVLNPMVSKRLPVHFGSPNPLTAEYFACLGELLQSTAAEVDRIDFLHPRRTIVKPNRRRLHQRLIAGAMAGCLLAGLVGLKLYHSRLDQQILDDRVAIEELDEIIKRGQPVLASAETLTEWEDGRTVWLDQFRSLHRLLPERRAAYFSEFRFTPGVGSLGDRIQATGFAHERRDVESLYQRLADRGYQVRPQEIQRNGQDSDYPYRFEIDVELPEVGAE